ncbi:sigma-70 family RNA polymerase sigma factor [Sporolactobacillus shoreicorticis]|uniref:Sigma-70 family RNA polymerase sigma factor n=1 Tax=Sporolactobacillus shoreicorticis TaxID=1923877 RepID=A0ABW5RY93_9BACL|nr:sigma-70 family RNA polymerase sigma factor [Sporolactobacillus shoreicorticis]MCO7125093.1 sigma-70 family RNA polymerase sigma factor [Sporolactobacillus shoreicorticis]
MNRDDRTLELIRQYQSGIDTRNEIIELNMSLAHFFTKKFKPIDMEYADALSITMAAFSQAIEKFDLSRETKFSTYAGLQVRATFSHIYRANQAKKRQGIVVSLDAPICESEGSTLTLLDTLAAPDQDHLLKDEALRLTKRVLNQFKDKYKRIILAHLNDVGTQLEIGKQHGISQIRVSRILAKFYAALKQEAERMGYREKEEATMARPLMSIDQYKDFVFSGLTLDGMADKLGVNKKSLYNWRCKNKTKIAPFEDKLTENIKKMNAPSSAQKKADPWKKEKADYLKSIQNQADTITHLEKRVKNLEAEKLDALEQLKDAKSKLQSLNDTADDLETKIAKITDEKKDIESQLMYTGQDRDKYFNLYQQSNRQLQALEAYVLTILEPAK